MPRGVPHPPELRAKVVSALSAGRSVRSIAREFGLDPGTVVDWRRQYLPGQTADAPTREELGDQVYGLVLDNLETLRVQARLARSPDWFKEQSAADIAALVTALSDRTLRLLAGFHAIEDQPALPEPQPNGHVE